MPSMSEWRQPYLLSNLRLGDRVVDVDGREEQRALLHHVVEAVHAGGGLLGDALDLAGDLGPAVVLSASERVEDVEDDLLLVRSRRWPGPAPRRSSPPRRRGGRAGWRRRRRRGSCWRTCRRASSGSARCTTSTPPASRPSRRRPGRPAGRSAVPSGPTATAAAAWSWVEKMLQEAQRTSAPSADEGLDEDGGLDGHVQRAGDPGAGQRLALAVALAHRHQAGHLVLGEGDLGAAEVGQGEVGDLEVHVCDVLG